ncbi:MAG: hypothetical protein IJV59_07560 [Eubacterium sp.]|nr:hypothetical protein [Eubacterium sp.]MBQ9642920.1 hypothetical protein [Lachnospiraceae bacterium]
MNETIRIIFKVLMTLSFAAGTLTVISAILMNRLPDQPDREELNDNIWDRAFDIFLVTAAISMIAGMATIAITAIYLVLTL